MSLKLIRGIDAPRLVDRRLALRRQVEFSTPTGAQICPGRGAEHRSKLETEKRREKLRSRASASESSP